MHPNAHSQFRDDNDRIGFFFDDPSRSPAEHSRNCWHSVLYLLRRELVETIGYDPNVSTEHDVIVGGAKHRVFASLILMFTVFDLAAKFMHGQVEGVGERFRAFLRSSECGSMSVQESDLLWAVRNSLVHAFGLPGYDSLASLGLNSIGLVVHRQAGLDRSSGLAVVERQDDAAVVYIDGLYCTVVESVGRCRESLSGSSSADSRTRFIQAFQAYGVIRVA